MKNPFFKPVESYQRELNHYDAYVRDAALLASKLSGDPFEVCLEWVRAQTKENGLFPAKDPTVYYLEKIRPGERVKRVGTMSSYLKEIHDRRLILSPTMAGYLHPDELESPSAKFLIKGLAQRSHFKALKFEAVKAGDALGVVLNENRQQREKIKNNSVSGAQGTTSSVLYNKSAHSTLTTICRSASSSTNANVERLLAGNRHYHNPDVTFANIVSTIRRYDYDLVERAIAYYGLVCPPADAVYKSIVDNCLPYWNSSSKFMLIRQLVDSMTDMERAAYLYCADMHNLAAHNPDLVKRLYDALIAVPTTTVDNPDDYVKQLGADENALLGITCDMYLKGTTVKDCPKKRPEVYGYIGQAAKTLIETMDEYALLFETFWTTKNIAASMANFPTSMRKVVVASDTDSCIFTNQQWVEWYSNHIDFSQVGFNVAAVTTYLCSLVTVHVLAVVSGNMGVAKQHMRHLEMKNEYAFKVFSLTSMAKHYFASKDAQEGIVFAKPKWEIKGATFRNSNAPKRVRERVDEMIEEICLTVMRGEKIKAMPILREIAQMEHDIIEGCRKGSPEFFLTAKLKPANAYKSANSNYLYHVLWNDVFGPKYGTVPEPPYIAVAVNIECDKPALIRDWIDMIADRELAERLERWLKKHNKKSITSILLPIEAIQSNGIPEEILQVMDVRRLVKILLKSYYLLLESLGFYITNKNNTRLVSDDIDSLTTQAAQGEG